MSPEFPIQTEHLVLRAFERDDLDPLAAFYLRPEALRYQDVGARDPSELRGALETMCRQRRLNRPGDAICLAVERQVDHRLVGQMSLRWTDATARQAELRFVFDPECRRPNVMPEALKRMLDLGFEELGFHRVFARCGARSEGSARQLRALGMRLEAHYREHALFRGEWDEELHFAILDREWLRSSKVKELNRHMVA